MNFDEYQKFAMESSVYGTGDKIIYPTLGLTGEAGEVADKVKKVLRDRNGLFSPYVVQDIMWELGDVLWYITAIARDLDISLEEVAQANVAKLTARRQKGTIHGSGDNR